MHYRITKVHHQPGKRDDIIEYLKTKDEDVRSIEGLQSVRMISISETESIAISKYENEQQLTMAEEKFKEIMGGMMPFMTAPPEVNNGDECWSMKK